MNKSAYETNKINDTLTGEQELAEIGMKLIPLIIKHFQPLDGQRATLASGGRSAKFDKACKAFQNDVPEITGLRIFIETGYSASVQFDINRPDSNTTGVCKYYRDSIYFADIDNSSFPNPPTGLMKWSMCDDNTGYEDKALQILATTSADIESAQDAMDAAIEAYNAARDGISYAFRELLPKF